MLTPAAVPPRFPLLDTDPHPSLGVYSAGNLGEVAPERISVTAWSLVGDPMERGARRLARRLDPRATWFTGSHYVFVGYFGCRPYHNLTAFCRLGSAVPGLRPEDVSRAYFEGAPAPALEAGWRLDARRAPGAAWRLLREVAGLRGRAGELEGRLLALEQGAGAGRGDARLEAARALVDGAWDLHVATTACLVPLHRLQAALGGRLSEHWPDVEPRVNRADGLVWDETALAAASDTGLRAAAEFMSHPFYEVADDVGPWSGWSAALRPAALPGPPAEAAAASAWPAAEDGIAEAFWGMLPALPRGALRALSLLVRDSMAAREHSKSLVMRALQQARGPLRGLARLRGLADQEWPLLTVRELAEGAGDLRELARARRAECETALATPMPDPLDVRVDAAPAAARRRRGGLGVSPGVVRGVAVGPSLEAAADGLPIVLVCEALDAEVAHLLPRVAGVVTARGSVLSHAAILAREHRVPAVLGCELARSIVPGSLVRLDGTTGEVELL